MKKLTLILAVVLLSSVKSFSQVNKTTSEFLNTTFCGKAGDISTSEVFFTKEELKNCDWKLQLPDSNYKVLKFKMTMVSREKSGDISEQEIEGNIIPEKYRNEILGSSRSVYLEYIKVGINKDDRINAKPIAIRIVS